MPMDPQDVADRIIELFELDGQDFPDNETKEKCRKSMKFIAQAIIEEIEADYTP